MSRTEKLRALEAIWADLAQDDQPLALPAWHGDSLREAEHAVEAGKAKFVGWETAK